MIELKKIYEMTDLGKTIIKDFCPQSAKSFENPKRPFFYRSVESEPSAYLLPPNSDYNRNDFWKIKDFGSSGPAISPIDVVMSSKDFSFYEAVIFLATKYNVTDDKERAACKPRIERRKASPKELAKDPSVQWFKLHASIPSQFLPLWAPHVNVEHLEELGWHSAEYTRSVNSDGELVTRYATEHYPIFIRECRSKDAPSFYKVYEPLNMMKRLRFSIIGQHVENYINGLYELQEAYELMKKSRKEKENDQDQKKEPKILRAVICSGERDAVCCYSRGEHPIWFNSETDNITGEKISSIMKYVEQLYNIPDIDATGRKQGVKLALRFISIKTVWLPDSLQNYHDDRGHKRKDLRDWMEMYPSQSDFNHLLDRAVEAKFWDNNGSARARNKYIINSVRLNYFLSLNGYYCLDENAEEPRLIHVQGNVIDQVWARDIRRFVYAWAHDSKQNVSMEVLETIQTSMRMKGNTLECIPKFSPVFNSCSSASQLFFFRNGTVKVTAEAIHFMPKGTPVEAYVWKDSIIDHDFAMFNTERWLKEDYPNKDEVGRLRSKGLEVQPLPFFSISVVENRYEINILQPELSPMFSYIINSSRLHWKKEMEDRFEGDLTAMQDYQRTHRFCIDGDGLSPEEISEQMQNLVNKIFTIGYLLHEFKAPTRAWAVLAMDNVVDRNGRCNGRSGKSFFGKAISHLCKTQELRGRDRKLLDNPHFLEEVTEETRIIHIEDCGRNFQVGPFFSLITSDMQVNVKMVRSMTLPFSQSPKFFFSTNYVLSEEDSSTSARILPVVFSDYYHMKSKNTPYLQDREISDDFGRQLMYDNYPEELWQADFMFMMQCLRFYLSVADSNRKIMPPMNNIDKRAKAQNLDRKFKAWAERFFFVEDGHLDTMLPRKEVYDNYCRFIGTDEPISKPEFMDSLRDFCDTNEHIAELNPAEYHTDHIRGRIMKRDGSMVVENIFVRSAESYAEDDPEDISG